MAGSDTGRVKGTGGLFFRARDPEALRRWHAAHPGIISGAPVWPKGAGPTGFAPFAADSDCFAADRERMPNLRIDGVDAVVGDPGDTGISVETRPLWDSPRVGRFARIHDPKGDPVALGESAPVAAP